MCKVQQIGFWVLIVALLEMGCGAPRSVESEQARRVEEACRNAGFAPCPALVVAVTQAGQGDMQTALTTLNFWMSQAGVSRESLRVEQQRFAPIARVSSDAARLFDAALRIPDSGETMMARVAVAAPPAPIASNTTLDTREWWTKSEFEAAKRGGSLIATNEGLGFLVVDTPGTAGTISLGERSYPSGTTIENVQSGYRHFSVSASGFERVEGIVRVEPLKVARISVSMRRGIGALTVLSEPSNAEVYLEGELRGRTPLTIEGILAGNYGVRVQQGPKVWRGRANVETGTTLVRAELLAPQPQPSPRPAPAMRPAPAPRPAAANATGRGSGVDLRTLGPELQNMAWKNLVGRGIVITLNSGERVPVTVRSTEPGFVILDPGNGQLARVPMNDIAEVEE